MARHTSRASAILAGALTGLVLAAGAFLGTMAIQELSNHNTVANQVPVWARILVFAPGVIGAGVVLAFPVATAMVFTTVGLSRRWSIFDAAVAWVLTGLIFAAPVAWLFSEMLENGRFSLFLVGSYGLLVGAVSGLAAWLFRPAKQAMDT